VVNDVSSIIEVSWLSHALENSLIIKCFEFIPFSENNNSIGLRIRREFAKELT
jgi:hypothetical protein